jgi:hypothetical protein
MYKLLYLVLFISCSSNIFHKKQPKKNELKAKAKAENNFEAEVKSWADSYYESTVLIINQPLFRESAKEVFDICQGKDIPFIKGYDSSQLSKVKFKRKPLVLYTKDGFKKSVYVTKGICREIALYKSQLKDNEKSFRKDIKLVKVHYLYNGDSFITEMDLETQFPSVKFLVK